MSDLRKSTRLKGKDTAAAYVDNDSSDEESQAVVATGKRKRPVKATSSDQVQQRPPKRRGKRGLLERLTEMPMDLLFEIFGKLDPVDVLHIARTTKALRSILMTKSAVLIWRETLSCVPGLPPCPDDLNEPQWADLVFGKNCQLCLRNVPGQHISWRARIKLCTRCTIQKWPRKFPSADQLDFDIAKKVPSIHISSGSRSVQGFYYHPETARKWIEEYAARQGDARNAWVKAAIEEENKRIQHATLCSQWLGNRECERILQAREERESRKDVILVKLSNEGYDKEVEALREDRSFWAESTLTQLLKKDISDRVWAGAKAQVLSIVEIHQQERIRRESATVTKARHALIITLRDRLVKERPVDDIILPAGNIFILPQVQALVTNKPISEELTLSDFDDIVAQLPDISAQWVLETKNKLLEMMKQQAEVLLSPEPVTEGALGLAVAWFQCTRCFSNSMEPDRAIVHNCATLGSTSTYKDGDDPFDLKTFSVHTSQYPWNQAGYIKFCAASSTRAATFLSNFGYDPKTTTREQLDALDEIFECESCSNFKSGRMMLDWRSVCLHACTTPRLVKMDEETATIIRSRMAETMIEQRAKAYPSYSNSYQYTLFCTHCRHKANASDLRAHLLSAHQIADATDADVAAVKDCSGRMPYRYWKFGSATFF